MTNKIASQYASPDNWCVGFQNQTISANKLANGSLTAFDYATMLNWSFSNVKTFTFTIDTSITKFGLIDPDDGSITNTAVVDDGAFTPIVGATENIDGTYSIPVDVANVPVFLISMDSDAKVAAQLKKFAVENAATLPKVELKWTNSQFLAGVAENTTETITFVPYMRITSAPVYKMCWAFISSVAMAPVAATVVKYPQFKNITFSDGTANMTIRIPDAS